MIDHQSLHFVSPPLNTTGYQFIRVSNCEIELNLTIVVVMIVTIVMKLMMKLMMMKLIVMILELYYTME